MLHILCFLISQIYCCRHLILRIFSHLSDFHSKMGGSDNTGAATAAAAAAAGTVMAAAANQAGMPDAVSGVENTPDARMNEKMSSGRTMSMNDKLRQGGDIKSKHQQGKSSVSADQSLRDLDDRVDQKMEDGNLDKLAYNGKKDGIDKGGKFDDGKTDTDLTDLGDPGDLDEWLAGEVIAAQVQVDEGGALQATLALEEELKQAVNAGAIKTLDEVDAEELEEALKEEDSRLKKYWKKFTVFGIVVAIAVGLSAGLTRGKAGNVTFMELEDICNYTNTRAPWLRSAVRRLGGVLAALIFLHDVPGLITLISPFLPRFGTTGTSRRTEGIYRHPIQRRNVFFDSARLCHLSIHVLRWNPCCCGRTLRR